MNESPYQPPSATLVSASEQERPGIGWKLYFGFLMLLVLLSYAAVGLVTLQAFDFLDMALSTVSTVGLFGYVFQKRIGRKPFWRVWLPSVLVWDLAYLTIIQSAGLGGMVSEEESMGFMEIGISFLILLPIYIGLFRYGNRCAALWESEEGH